MEQNKLEQICSTIVKKYNEKYVKEAFNLLCVLFNNIICNPSQDKFRNFKVTNFAIKTKILAIVECMDLIKEVGYVQKDNEILKYEGDEKKLKEATFIIKKYMTQIEQVLKKEEEKEKEAQQRLVQENLAKIKRQMQIKKEEEDKIREELENDKKEREKMDRPTESKAKELHYGCTEIKIEPSRGG